MSSDPAVAERRPASAGSRRTASLVSDTFGPLPPLAALCGAGAAHSGSPLAGAAWGVLAMFFVAILPYVVTWRIRHPAHGGRPSPRARLSYMGLAVVTAVAGLGVLRWLGAPGAVISVVIAILVTLAVVTVTNARWGWSNHLAACAAGVAMLVVLFGVAGLWALPAVPAVAWARLTLGRHTPVELALGAVVGVVVSAAVLTVLT